MRYRITVRGEGCELRGYLDDNDPTSEGLKSFAQLLYPFGIVVASPAAEDYNPFTQEGGSLGGF